MKKITLKPGKTGGSLVIAGGKSDWPFSIAQAQDGPIDVRLAIGGDVYCARFTTFDSNEAGAVKGRDAAAPATCATPAPAVCGDGVATGTEECDDGGTTRRRRLLGDLPAREYLGTVRRRPATVAGTTLDTRAGRERARAPPCT